MLASRIGIKAAFDCAAPGCESRSEIFALAANELFNAENPLSDVRFTIPLPHGWCNIDQLIYCPGHFEVPVDQRLRISALLDFTAIAVSRAA